MIESTYTVGVNDLLESLVGSEGPDAMAEASPVDVVNFEKEFADMDKAESFRIPDSNFSTGPTTLDIGGGRGTISQNMIQDVVEIDAHYKDVIRRIDEKPSFGAYLEKHGVSLDNVGGAEQSGIRHVSNVDDVINDRTESVSLEETRKERTERLESLLETNRAHYSAGLDYSVDLTRWHQEMSLWFGKIKILGAAISLTSRGLKTLFTSQ